MAAKDVFHETVRNALGKAGWTITHDMFHIKIDDGSEVIIDLAAERVIIAEKIAKRLPLRSKAFCLYLPFMNFIQHLVSFLTTVKFWMNMSHSVYCFLPFLLKLMPSYFSGR